MPLQMATRWPSFRRCRAADAALTGAFDSINNAAVKNEAALYLLMNFPVQGESREYRQEQKFAATWARESGFNLQNATPIFAQMRLKKSPMELELMQHAIDAEPPHRGAAQRREQHPPHRIAQRVAVAALERLQAELGDVRVVVALRHLDELRPHQPAQINSLCHTFVRSVMWSGGDRVAAYALPRP